MVPRGLPDLYHPLRSEGLEVFYPYEGAGSYVLTPDGLGLARLPDGRCDFGLELVRGKNSFLPPKPYGLLNFRLAPRYRMDAAISLLPAGQPGATLVPASFSAGLLRFLPLEALEVPPELLRPTPLAWNGLNTARVVIKLSQPASALVEGILRQGMLALSAVVDLEIDGVSPRVPIRLSFDPASLLRALLALCDEQRQVSRAALIEYIHDNLAALPIDIQGQLAREDIGDFAEALTNWLRVRFGTFVAAPAPEAGPHFALPPDGTIGSGRFEWDLSEPIQAPYPLTLSLKPFEEAQRLIQQQSLDSLISKTIVPNIPTGLLPVTIVANLPAQPKGVLALGVNIRTEPNAPLRPQAQVETVELSVSQATPTVNLRFAPREQPVYTVTPYVVVRDALGIAQLDGNSKPQQGDVVYLGPDDFPLDFVTVGAAPSLLAVAAVRGTLARIDADTPVEQQFELTAERPVVSLALPKGTDQATLTFQARSSDDSKVVSIGPLPARPIQIDLFSFREYQTQRVEVRCVFGERTQPVVVEFLAEGAAEEDIQMLFFRPDRDTDRFVWHPRTLFQYRYRYRLKMLGQGASAGVAWSDYLSPFEPLTIELVQPGANDD